METSYLRHRQLFLVKSRKWWKTQVLIFLLKFLPFFNALNLESALKDLFYNFFFLQNLVEQSIVIKTNFMPSSQNLSQCDCKATFLSSEKSKQSKSHWLLMFNWDSNSPFCGNLWLLGWTHCFFDTKRSVSSADWSNCCSKQEAVPESMRVGSLHVYRTE